MAEATIDRLSIEITSSSDKAVKSIDRLTASIQKLKASTGQMNGLKQLATSISNLSKVSPALTSIKQQFDTLRTSVEGLSGSIDKLDAATDAIKDLKIQTTQLNRVGGFRGFITGANQLAAFSYVLRRTAEATADFIRFSDMAPAMRQYKAALGDMTDAGVAYSQAVSDALHIDPKQWMNTQGTLTIMAKGFGVAEDQAYRLGQSLTELSYDVAAFTGIGVEDAAAKIRSALSGEIEPIRNLGFAVNQASLQEFALSKGITESVSAMTEQEKALLRSIKVLEDAKGLGYAGAWKESLESPTGALAAMGQQFRKLGQTIGGFFIPIVAQVMPWFVALTDVVTDAISTFATFLGFSMPDWSAEDWSAGIITGADNGTDALKETEKAVKDLKSATIGIDELNIISPGSAAGEGKEDGSSWADGLEVPNFWNADLLGDINEKTERLKETLAPLLGIIDNIAAGLAGWKIAKTLIGDAATLKELLAGAAVGFGLSLIFEGFKEIIWGDGLTWESLLYGTAGGALVGGGVGALLAKKLGLTWSRGMLSGAVVGVGVTLAVMGVTDVALHGLDAINLSTTSGAFALLGGVFSKRLGLTPVSGILTGAVLGLGVSFAVESMRIIFREGVNFESVLYGALAGSLAGGAIGFKIGGLAGGAQGALIGLSIGVGVNLVAHMIQNWDEIAQAFKDGWTGIRNWWVNDVEGWWANDVQPYFQYSLWSDALVPAWQSIKDGWSAARTWWNTDVSSWWSENVVPWFKYSLWSGALAPAWQSIKDGWSAARAWWNTDVAAWWADGVVPWFTLEKWAELGRNIWDGIVQGVGNLWAKAKELGENVVDGFVDGIRGLVDGAVDIGQGLIDGLKEALDIHSPSREMATIGEYAAAGLVQGFGVEALSSALREQLDIMRADALAFAAEFTDILGSAGVDVKASLAADDSRPSGKGESLDNVTDQVSDVRKSILGGFNGTGAGLELLASLTAANTQQQAEWFDMRQTWLDQFSVDLFNIKQAISEAEITNINTGLASFKAQTVSNTSRIQGALLDFNSSVNAAIANAASRIVASTDQIRINIYNTYSMGGMGFASGGFPEPSQLFYAREGGAPELVGRIGNQTAVANNDQIIAGVRDGVAEANIAVVQRLSEMEEQLERLIAKTGVTLDGKQLAASVERANMRHGARIMRWER